MYIPGPLPTLLLSSLAIAHVALASPLVPRNETCRRTKVAILGAGVAGITAAQALHNQSVEDFVIVEYNGEIGGRVAHTNFGADKDGKPYVVEIGANWVQGLVTEGGPENPIWALAQKWNITNTYSNYSSIQTFNGTGAVDYTDLLDDFEDAYSVLEQDAGYILSENLQDRSVRSGLSLAGWKPKSMEAQAVEWWEWDWEYAYSPELSSQEFGIVNYNTTFYQFSDANNFVIDQRGFSHFLISEASTFLSASDPRLLFNTTVTNISYTSPDAVTITNADGSCIMADHTIVTFSLGVLQNSPTLAFEPELPAWKQEAISSFSMGTYTKLFLQFPLDTEPFWNTSYQFFLYASPSTRGYYPVWQSLSSTGFIPDSNILFATVVQDESARVERMSDADVQAELLTVLRQMYGAAAVPEPTAFHFPRWGTTEWAYGSYSNWPPGVSLAAHENLRATVDGRVWFAGEATSAEYFGFLQGAWFEGQSVGAHVAACVKNGTGSAACGAAAEKAYEVLHGTTPESMYDAANGWEVTSFQTNGF
ncbi:MAG: hypothetical protein M1819_004055 [Sarea resinae]|nr:MAG: hypothetical protein M1819_004055 [Sarea resinae]